MNVDLVTRMKRYLSAEGCAMSTIIVYSNTLSMLLKSHPNFDKYNSEELVYLLSMIKDPIYRSSIRNVVLKVHRDMLGKSKHFRGYFNEEIDAVNYLKENYNHVLNTAGDKK